MTALPAEFSETIKRMLGEEYPSFLACYDGKQKRRSGLRVNTAKIALEEFERISPFPLEKIPWIPNGYFYEEQDAPARHPFYAAGLYYLQEPSAMTPASRLPVFPGDAVLDLCAAPGGKATELAARLAGEGWIVANDINPSRARALLRNLELFGIDNAFVTREPPRTLARKFPERFDKVMVDAPCSGEGMFRKNPAAIEAWMEKGPDYFSGLQKEIVLCGADMLRPGGLMMYSTCTFSPKENERIITHLLKERPDMALVPMEDYEGFSEGLISFDGETFPESCRLCRRIWPHKMDGEGHFMALLEKRGGGDVRGDARRDKRDIGQAIRGDSQDREGERSERQPGTLPGKERKAKKERQEKAAVSSKEWWRTIRGADREQRESLGAFFSQVSWTFQPDQIDIRGDKVYFVPEGVRENAGIRFLRNGLYLGDLKKRRFEPSQPFALALSADTFAPCLNFSPEDERLSRYLRGEDLPLCETDSLQLKSGDASGRNGDWVLILAGGYPLGFGKIFGRKIKNKYPAGWRNRNQTYFSR